MVGDDPNLVQKMISSTISTADLKSNASKANKTLRDVTVQSVDGNVVCVDLPEMAVVSRRFPISQSEKVRPVDDFSQSQVNSTVTTYEQTTVDGPELWMGLS